MVSSLCPLANVVLVDVMEWACMASGKGCCFAVLPTRMPGLGRFGAVLRP